MLLGIVVAVLTVYALVDLIHTPDRELRYLSLTTWAAIVLLVPVLGALAWLSIGRGEVRRYRPRTPGFELSDAADRPLRFPSPRRPEAPSTDAPGLPTGKTRPPRERTPPRSFPVPDPWGSPPVAGSLPAVGGLDPDDPEDRWLLEQIARRRTQQDATATAPDPSRRRDPGPRRGAA